ncbi:MAG: NAD(P)H-dependent oxidoreductase [Eubacterium sp.]|nr:NAD(P)H-dependent oxidoreductase [Eubacterium sp.]
MSKMLVTYFSASGVTGKVAKELAKIGDADLFEIKPQVPYTDADLKWMNPMARCNKEKFGKKDVPVEGRVENMSEYDLILIGFPIWYYGAPNIINTFVKDYDFSGKKIALFATSGGSDITKSPEKLKPYLSDTAEIVGAKLFRGADEEEMKQWLESLV